MSKELTPWFPAEVKPVRKGFYERDYGFEQEDIADYWDGNAWWVIPTYDLTERIPGLPVLPWRGLAKKP
mgnify:CR=1 FL=1